ncbi:hypothetical protein FEK47_07260 [Escherichia sp. E3659]|nr:hypothetical protein [Escherichia coli]TGB88628.1 hypothetical protein CRI65_00190 [Escherichia sp. E3659]TLJ12984.1 hypothetical protein FEK47_07260 [Escherichia sp. E3659]
MRQRTESMKFCCVCQFYLIHSKSCRIKMNFDQLPGRQGALKQEKIMWKPTGDKLITALIDGKPQYLRIEMSGQHTRLIRE